MYTLDVPWCRCYLTFSLNQLRCSSPGLTNGRVVALIPLLAGKLVFQQNCLLQLTQDMSHPQAQLHRSIPPARACDAPARKRMTMHFNSQQPSKRRCICASSSLQAQQVL